VLLLLLHRIAYFYEVTSRQPTHYRLFILPMALLLLGGLCYLIAGDLGEADISSLKQVIGTARLAGDSLQLAGGISLVGLGVFILRLMTGGRR